MDVSQPLSPRQIRAIPHLLRAPTIEEGCRRARVSKAAVYLWLENEAFREELRRQREQLTVIALEGLGASVVKASAVLVRLLESPKDHIKLKAAETIVRLARRSMMLNGMDGPVDGTDDEAGLDKLVSPETRQQITKWKTERKLVSESAKSTTI